MVGLWTIRLSACAVAHIECSSRSRAEDMTITNVIIKTPDRKWDWYVNDVMPGSENLVISKKTLVEIWLWARPVQLGATGWYAFVGSVSWDFDSGRGQFNWGLRDDTRLLGQLVEILTLGRAVQKRVEIWLWAAQSSWGLTEGRCRNSQHSKNCISLSSCRKTKLKKLINVSYLNNESRQCFGISLHPYICIVVSWLYNKKEF